jgi:hypothetical protein
MQQQTLAMAADQNAGLAQIREPIALERMLHMDVIRHWFNLADLACKEGLSGSSRNKSRIRTRIEQAFCTVKRSRGLDKVRYCGPARNATRSCTALALVNVFLARGSLMAQMRP